MNVSFYLNKNYHTSQLDNSAQFSSTLEAQNISNIKILNINTTELESNWKKGPDAIYKLNGVLQC